MNSRFLFTILCAFLLGSACTAALFHLLDRGNVAAQERPFVGGIREDREAAAAKPIAVRNDVAQPGTPIVTLRHFRIQKGRFEEFHKASIEGVWPYFEKIGARVVGMWKQIHPEGTGSEESPQYDDVYLMTRYASVAHWSATRDMAALGGNGPDWEKAREALAHRREMTLETSVIFLDGDIWHNPPQFLPGLGETFDRVE